MLGFGLSHKQIEKLYDQNEAEYVIIRSFPVIYLTIFTIKMTQQLQQNVNSAGVSGFFSILL